MPTSPYFPTYYAGHSGEQGLVQDLVDEQIKLFGSDIYYMPRTILQDYTLDDIIYSKYESQFQIKHSWFSEPLRIVKVLFFKVLYG